MEPACGARAMDFRCNASIGWYHLQRKFSTRPVQCVLVKAAVRGAHFFGHFLMAVLGRRPVDDVVTQKYLVREPRKYMLTTNHAIH